MALTRKLKSFVRLPYRAKLLFFEALVTSGYVHIALLLFPFKKIAGWLRSNVAHTGQVTADEDLVKRVRFAIRLCRKYAPWSPECYVSALTAKIMLRRRKLSSTLYFGFLRDTAGMLKGHAWLKSSDIIVTGHCDFSKYQVHSSFS